MEDGREDVAAFANKNIIGHINIIPNFFGFLTISMILYIVYGKSNVSSKTSDSKRPAEFAVVCFVRGDWDVSFKYLCV